MFYRTTTWVWFLSCGAYESVEKFPKSFAAYSCSASLHLQYFRAVLLPYFLQISVYPSLRATSPLRDHPSLLMDFKKKATAGGSVHASQCKVVVEEGIILFTFMVWKTKTWISRRGSVWRCTVSWSWIIALYFVTRRSCCWGWQLYSYNSSWPQIAEMWWCVCVCVSVASLSSASPCLSPQISDMFLLQPISSTPSSSPDSSGHLQSHPTLPITSSILVTVGAPKQNSPLRPHKPTLLFSVFRCSALRSVCLFYFNGLIWFFAYFFWGGELKRAVGVQNRHWICDEMMLSLSSSVEHSWSHEASCL